jgi:hypothetical protein
MEQLFLILSIIGFCRVFYFAIGEPMTNHRSDAILYIYTNMISKLIAKIHGIKSPKYEYFWSVQHLIDKYYKFLGFCYICFSFWVFMIFFIFCSENLQEYLMQVGVALTFNFLLKQWTI